MYFYNHKFFLMIAIACLLGLSACGAAEQPAANTGGDIEAQSIPVSTATPTVAPALEAQPTLALPATDQLPTEIIEPISPISPASPIEIVPTAENAAMSAIQSMEIIPGSEEPLAAALEDLSQTIGVPVEQISLVSMEEMDWPDASLGCPQEGFMYAQVITPGYRLVLEAQGQTYEYHTDKSNNIILCQP